MEKILSKFMVSALLVVALVQGCNQKSDDSSTPERTQLPQAPPSNFKNEIAHVNGVDIHYVIGGSGDPLVLIHGFGQNWYMWNRLLPELSKHFTVIAPDLRGVGESSKPEGGYDKKNMAVDIHELVHKLGYTNIRLVGHDIGLMVAYAYAAQFGNEVLKLALCDAMLPGIEPVWHKVSSTTWHFGFFSRPIAGDLVAGKENEFFNDFWPQQYGDNKDPFTKDEATEFIRAYSTKDGTKSAFKWFAAFPIDAKDNLELAKTKLKMPLLAVAGEHTTSPFLADHLRLVADNVTELKVTGSGHWIVQENTDLVKKGLLDFFLDNQTVTLRHEHRKVNNVDIHYVVAGKGDPLLLLHGFGQNWYMWNRLLPELTTRFTVVAPDLRGVGQSGKPLHGYEKTNMAKDMHELMEQLGYKKINLVGHDIGLLVAYAYASQYRDDVKKLVLMDALLPGIDPSWSTISPTRWWYSFFSRPVASDLVTGRESLFLNDFWSIAIHNKDAFTEDERRQFIAAYSEPNAIASSFHWFKSFPQDVVDNRKFFATKIEIPVLSLGGEFASAKFLGSQCRLVASNVTEIIIKGAGHWIVQEQTAQVSKALKDFLKD